MNPIRRRPAPRRPPRDDGPSLPVAGQTPRVPLATVRAAEVGDGDLGRAIELAHRLLRQGCRSGEAALMASRAFRVPALDVARHVSESAVRFLSRPKHRARALRAFP